MEGNGDFALIEEAAVGMGEHFGEAVGREISRAWQRKQHRTRGSTRDHHGVTVTSRSYRKIRFLGIKVTKTLDVNAPGISGKYVTCHTVTSHRPLFCVFRS